MIYQLKKVAGVGGGRFGKTPHQKPKPVSQGNRKNV